MQQSDDGIRATNANHLKATAKDVRDMKDFGNSHCRAGRSSAPQCRGAPPLSVWNGVSANRTQHLNQNRRQTREKEDANDRATLNIIRRMVPAVALLAIVNAEGNPPRATNRWPVPALII